MNAHAEHINNTNVTQINRLKSIPDGIREKWMPNILHCAFVFRQFNCILCVCARAQASYRRRCTVNANAVNDLATSIINRMRIEHRMREWKKNRMNWAKQLLLVVFVLPHFRTHIYVLLNCSTMPPPLSHFISFSLPSSCVLIVISISSINNYFNPLNSEEHCCRLPSHVRSSVSAASYHMHT